MNMELMEKVAQWLEAGAPHEVSGGMGFDMNYMGSELNDKFIRESYRYHSWVNPACGTVGCIAGAINQFAGNNILKSGESSAIKALGLDPDDDEVYNTFDRLFYPRAKWEDEDVELDWDDPVRDSFEYYNEYYNASPQQAAKVVRHFMATGEVDWEKAFE